VNGCWAAVHLSNALSNAAHQNGSFQNARLIFPPPASNRHCRDVGGTSIRTLQLLIVTALLGMALPGSGRADGLNLGQYRGKVVVLDFWASWCAPCRRSFPWLNEIQAKYRDRLVVIGVNVDRNRADAAQFLREVPATFSVIYDPDGELATRYDVPGMPSSFIFDAQGNLVAKHIGFRSSEIEEREHELRRLLPSATNP
jgi:cytochrome c biogenesis protein CcmG, thiol:disulfide interchange protein DsbE